METNSAQQTGQEKKRSGKNEFIPFYFGDFVKGLKKYWWLLALLIVVFGGVRFFFSYRAYVPYYSTSATFTISTAANTDRTDGGMTSYSFYYDSAITTQLSTVFPYILSSNILQDAICEELDLDYMPATLSASSVSGSNMFTITCTGTDPQMVYNVIMCAIDKCPEAARYVVGQIKFTMITNPYVPTSPYNRNSFVKDSFRMAMLGVFFGLVWILIYCLSRKTVRTREEISEKLGQEALGTLPYVTFKKYKKEKIDRSVLWTNQKVDRSFLESFRLMRNTVLHELTEDEKTVLVTSTAPGEGKTTVAENLALSLADVGKKILLIDWDIRNPSVLQGLNVELPEEKEKDKDKDKEEESDEAYKILFLEQYGIYVLVFNSGRNYWKRMRTEFIESLLNEVREEYDYIIIDTPPCGLISDTEVIAQSVDAAVYVILQDAVRISRVKAGIDNLLSGNTRILGCVLNGAESGASGYGYGYGGYGYSRYSYYGRYGYYGYGYAGYSRGYAEEIEKTNSSSSSRKRTARRSTSRSRSRKK